MQDLRFPIGPFDASGPADASARGALIRQIVEAPGHLRAAVAGLKAEQVDAPYRPGGWTIRQVVHHLPDSHVNAYVRFRLALTDDAPLVKVYDEARWAELEDARTGELELSLALFDALHRRWATLLEAMEAPQWQRAYRHPELGLLPLDKALALYAWHGRHHVAHVTRLRDRNGWSGPVPDPSGPLP